MRPASGASLNVVILYKVQTTDDSIFQSLNARKLDPFQVFERGTAARRDMGKFVRPWLVNERRSSVAAPNQTVYSVQVRNRLTHLERALRESRHFEETEGTIPNNGARRRQVLDKL